MSSTEKESPPAAKTAVPAKKGGAIVALGSVLLSALLSGGAAFGAARMVGNAPPPPQVIEHRAARPPGPTVQLDSFLASIADSAGQMHALKLTVAIELEHDAKAEELAPFIPRIRDTTLSYLRERTFEQVSAQSGVDKMRAELLTRYEAVGLVHARKILVTDLITQ